MATPACCAARPGGATEACAGAPDRERTRDPTAHPAEGAAAAPARPRLRRAAAPVAALLVLALSALVVTVLTGSLALARVATASMAPAVAPGSLVVGRPVPPRGVRVGELLTAHVPALGRSVTHRVVSVRRVDERLVVTTRGDANPTADAWTTTLPQAGASRVVLVVPRLGQVLGRGPGGVPLLAAPLLVLAASWYGCRHLLRALQDPP